MKVSAFTFIRNVVKLGFPAVESIRSVLPIVDEFVVNIGQSEDGTMELIKSLNEPKIKILDTRWNDRMLVKGFVYGQQKTIAQFNCTGDWAFYLEADEIVHESELDKVYHSMERHLGNPEVEALVFDYYHFYGNHATYLDSPAWYRRAPRVIRNTIRSFAPGGLYWIVLDTNKKGRYPRAALADAHIYHYGWVRSEEQMRAKSESVSKFWDGKAPSDVNYGNIDPVILREFKGAHPKVMEGWLPKEPTPFSPDPSYRISSRERRHRLQLKLERALGIDTCKKHYRLVAG